MRDTKRRTRKPLTVARILAGSDRAELLERAAEVAVDPSTTSMLLVWEHDGVGSWRNAGMTCASVIFACESIKFEILRGDDAD